jgi:4'-phosphopantetheinyl transferase
VEALDRRAAAPEIARSHFAPDETRFLESLPEGERPRAFLALWTLKEAYIKARGMGLSIPLADFAFTLEPLRIAFSPHIEDQPSNWFFQQSSLAPAHVLALAVEREPEEELSVHVREVGLESLQGG